MQEIRRIEFAVTPGGITPTAPQPAGVQGEHNATMVVFRLDDTLAAGGYRCRIELVDAAGRYDATGLLEPANGEVSCLLPERWTRAGGTASVRLVLSVPEASDEGVMREQTVRSYAGRLTFAPRQDSGERYAALSALVRRAEEAAARAEAAAAQVGR